ncbi:MAG: hypothetical protein P4L84_07595 [Isosphaeraceae bacterium]|nr:hypothetical protein [Isosphaeraceae bacterium]
MSRTDAPSSLFPSTTTHRPGPEPEARDRLAAGLLRGPLAVVLAGMAALQLASWLPHYLTWPFWADHDVYATLAYGWEHGQLPYRDLACNNFPGTIYLFWALGRIAGWGRTLPFYALDAAFVVAFGVAMLAWSRRLFSNVLPGLAGYTAFLSYYLSQDYARAGQHDWHAAFFAVVGILAVECWSSRAARLLSGCALALAVTTRPQAVLFLPAVALALDERSRAPGESLRRSVRPCLEWGSAFLVFLALGFAPLAAAGVLPDFVHGVRLASYGSRYNQVTPASVFSGWVTQLSPLRFTVVPVALLLFHHWGDPRSRRTALTWGVALAAVSLYKPLSPMAHGYLDIPLLVVWTVSLATLVHLVLCAVSLAPSLRLGFVLLLLALGTTARPGFCVVSPTLRAVTALRHGHFPDGTPVGYRRGSVPTGAYYSWDDYHAAVEYLKRETTPETRVANVLKGDSAITGPTARGSAFPAESITWLKMVNPADEQRFADGLAGARNSVVVWVPGEAGPPPGQPLPLITPVILRDYEPAARFGAIEVWRRKREGSQPGVTSR